MRRYSPLLLLAVSLSSPGWAEPVTILIRADVSVVDDRTGVLEEMIDVGDTLRGAYTYDSATADTNSAPTVGHYWHDEPLYGLVFQIGGLLFQTNPSKVEFLVEIVNDHNWPATDNYLIRSYNNLPLANGVGVLTSPGGSTTPRQQPLTARISRWCRLSSTRGSPGSE